MAKSSKPKRVEKSWTDDLDVAEGREGQLFLAAYPAWRRFA
jgi:hypothetical protein